MDYIEASERTSVIDEARSWVRTPYHHGASIKGTNGGVDCAMFVKSVYENARIITPGTINVEWYSEQWFMHHDRERLIEEIKGAGATEIGEDKAIFGDLVIYKLARAFAHAAIIVPPGWPWIIHSSPQLRGVCNARGEDPPLLGRERKFFTMWPMK